MSELYKEIFKIKITIIILGILLSYNTIKAQDINTAKNLYAFAKVYGYVRYFHPSIESENVNWNRFVLNGVNKIQNIQNQNELNKTLMELFYPIAPSIRIYSKPEQLLSYSSSLVKSIPDYHFITFWQHYGCGTVNSLNPDLVYRSNQINNKNLLQKFNNSGAGNVNTSIKANNYRGKKIKLTGHCKLLENSTGTGHLWLNIPSKNGNGFFENMSNSPIIKNSWEKYEIIGTVSDSANKIAFGCFLLGKGNFMVDDISLAYLENDIWIDIPIVNSGFEEEEIVKDINKARSKDYTWGYSNNHDYFFSIVNENPFKDQKCLSIISRNPVEIKFGKLFSNEPFDDEFINKKISDDLYCFIPYKLHNDTNEIFSIIKQNKIDSFMSSMPLTNKSGIDMWYSNIIITWNILQHFYPNFEYININWENELLKALNKIKTNPNENQFKSTLLELLAPLKDGHIAVYKDFFYNLEDKIYLPPINFEHIENKIVITKVCSNVGIKIGDIVTEIEGVKVFTYIDSIKKQISASNIGSLKYKIENAILYGERNSTLKLKIKNKTYELIRDISSTTTETKCNNNKEGLNVDFKLIDSSILYINFSNTSVSSIEDKIGDILKAKAIICDFRGGCPINTELFISHLLKRNDSSKCFLMPKIIYPDHEKICGYDSFGWNLRPIAPYITAKMFFLINPSVISSTESYLNFIEGYKLGTIVGQPSAGSNGNVVFTNLMGGYIITWTGLKVIKFDGSQFYGVGITPNIFVKKTIKGIKNEKDESLETAINLAKKSIKL